MYVLVDKERMCVLYKHSNPSILSNLAHIEAAHSSCAIVNIDSEQKFGMFTDLELKLLYANLCGQKYTGYARVHLVQAVLGLCTALEESDLDGFEILLQANCIEDGDDNYYQYQRGANIPIWQEEIFVPSALTTSATNVSIQPHKPAPNAAPIPLKTPPIAPANVPKPVQVPISIVITDWTK